MVDYKDVSLCNSSSVRMGSRRRLGCFFVSFPEVAGAVSLSFIHVSGEAFHRFVVVSVPAGGLP